MFDKNESITTGNIADSKIGHIGHSYNKTNWIRILIVALFAIGIIAICILYATGVINQEMVQELMKIISGTTKAVL